MLQLQQIKPKTLPDDKYAYLEKDACLLNFSTSSVLMPSGTGMDYQPAVISIKDLFNMELDCAQSVKDNLERIYIPDLDWKTIPINIADVNAFNGIASAGDSIYWHGKLSFNKKNMTFKVAGFIYYMEYNIPKILDWAPSDGIEFSIDHNACYYFYQMFKSVTKTKPKILKLAWDKENFYFKEDSEDCDYTVIVPISHAEYKEKDKSFKYICNKYNDSKPGLNSKTIKIDRVSYCKDKDSLVKHLLKSCGDSLSVVDDISVGLKYESDAVKLWINKKK